MTYRWITRMVGLVALFASAFVHAQNTLRVLTWPGYADPDLVKAFEERHNARVEVTYISTDDALWQRLLNSGNQPFDVFAANTAELSRAVKEKRSLPLSLNQIPNTQHQLPRFRHLKAIPGIAADDKVYAIPYTYSEMGLIYNRKLLSSAPTSINALWDTHFRGKVLAYDGSSHNFSLAAQALGVNNPFQLQPNDWDRAVEKLVSLRRNVLTFYSQPEEVVHWFNKESVAIVFANYGGQQVKLLRDAGADIGYVIPQEGALAWLDCWSILRTTLQPELAHAWINYMLEPDVSKALTARQGLNNTLQATQADQEQDTLVWLQPVEDIHRRTTLWNSIRSGDSL